MIKKVKAEETYPLRKEVLRKNFPNETHKFLGDFEEETFHLAYFFNEEIIGVLTMMKIDEKTFQLRGMAVSEKFQRKNIGKSLIEEAEQILKRQKISKIWMNARLLAIPFYEKCGYIAEGNFFEIPPIGTHIKMKKHL